VPEISIDNNLHEGEGDNGPLKRNGYFEDRPHLYRPSSTRWSIIRRLTSAQVAQASVDWVRPSNSDRPSRSASISSSVSNGAAFQLRATQQCSTALPSNQLGHWSWRMIDGRKCWYEGKPLLSKSLLEWAAPGVTERRP
jgi:hypothetical protein